MLKTETIRKLYPVDRFPIEYYPDIITVISNSFNAQTKSIPQNGADISADFIRRCSLQSLLKNDPGALVLLYSHLIRIYVNTHCFNPEDRDDVYQEIIRRILQNKIKNIRANYDFDRRGERSFSSYFMAVVRSVYLDMVKSDKTQKERMVLNSELDKTLSDSASVEWLDEATLQKEFNKLNFIFKLFGKKRAKVEMLLKLKFRIPLQSNDIQSCLPEITKEEEIIFLTDYKTVKDKDLFKAIEPVFIKFDGKENKPDSLRRWINLKTKQILEILNKSHNNHVYDDGILEILLHLYYQKR